MADIQWKGGVEAVGQVADATVDTYDAASTYTVTIGDYTVSTSGGGTVTAVATALATALNALAHPYFAAITWSDATGTLTATADVAGVPFDAALTVSGGTGTVTDFSDTTACTGPHHADDAENYEGGALPTTGDRLIVAGGPSILYGLTALAAVDLAALEIRQSFDNQIGLYPLAFATSLDGATTEADFLEYRATHFQHDTDVTTIGEHNGPGNPAGSSRLQLEQKSTTASRLVVVDSASTTTTSAPAIDFIATDADADVDVRYAPGGVGIGGFPGATATVGDVSVSDRSSASEVYIGEGVTLSNFEQAGGVNQVSAAATVAAITVRGGELAIRGEGYTITTLNVEGGSVEDTHLNTAGVEWTTINMRGGALSLPHVYDAGGDRTVTTINHSRGRVEGNLEQITATTWSIAPAAGVSSDMAVDLTDQ